MNIYSTFTKLLVSQLFKGRLKELAPKNMEFIVVTLLILLPQAFRGWLKELAPRNM